MKRLLSLLLVLSLSLGCIGVAASEDTVTLRIAFWGSQARADIMTKEAALFNQKNPTIKGESGIR